MFSNIAKSFQNILDIKDKEIKDAFHRGKKAGMEEGISLGMRKHFEMTSELTNEENELLLKFLDRHNMVLCYEDEYGGFRVRKNDRINPRKKEYVTVVKDQPNTISVRDSTTAPDMVETITVSLVRKELMDMDCEHIKNKNG